MARVPADATAFPQRAAHFTMNVHTRWDDPAKDAACIGWARELFDRDRALRRRQRLRELHARGRAGPGRLAAYGGNLAAAARRSRPSTTRTTSSAATTTSPPPRWRTRRSSDFGPPAPRCRRLPLPRSTPPASRRHDRTADRPRRSHPHRPRLRRALVAGGAAALRRRPPPLQVRAPRPPRRHAAAALRDRRDDRPPRRRDRRAGAGRPSSASATASTIAPAAPRSPPRTRRGSPR